MSERAQPFHCPWCGDENLFPREGAGAWECRSCLRSFTVQMTGMIPHPGTGGEAP